MDLTGRNSGVNMWKNNSAYGGVVAWQLIKGLDCQLSALGFKSTNVGFAHQTFLTKQIKNWTSNCRLFDFLGEPNVRVPSQLATIF